MSSAQKRRWLIYALGGGAGHLTRATALARAAIRNAALFPSGLEICILTNSSFAEMIPVDSELGSGHQVIRLASDQGRAKTAQQVHEQLTHREFDVLIVDTFPRGLGGELKDVLPALNCRKVLVHRDLNPEYCSTVDVASSLKHFDLVLVPGESAPFSSAPNAVVTAPWLIRDADELLSPEDARRKLAVDSMSKPVVTVIGCGTLPEIREMQSLADELSGRFASAAIRLIAPIHVVQSRNESRRGKAITVSTWPFLEVIRAVSVIVGSGGYNTANEASATGTPLIGIARKRLYDRQERRLRLSGEPTSLPDVATQLATLLELGATQHDHPTPNYVNGVHQAVESIVSVI